MKLGSSLLAALTLGAVLAPAPMSAPAVGAAVEEPVEVDILDLTSIRWEPGDPLPKEIEDLDGKRVVIRGYMHQSITDETSEFPLVSDACQCTGNLMPHHFVQVDLGPRETDPIPGSFEVIGTLSVGEVEEDGFVTSVYRLRGRIY